MTRKNFTVSLCIAFLLVVVGIFAYRRVNQMTFLRPSNLLSNPSSTTTDVAWSSEVDEQFVDVLAERLRSASGGVLESEKEALQASRRIAELVRLYADGGWEKYDTYLAGQQLVPWPSRAPGKRTDWSPQVRPLVGSSWRPATTTVETLYKHGEGSWESSYRRDGRTNVRAITGGRNGTRGPADVANPSEAKTDRVEVRVPGRFKGRDTTASTEEWVDFEGALAVQLTRRPSDGVWIVTGVGFADVPNGIAVSPPPF